ncbi:MAG: GMC family oxidoreductase [Leptolyngbyaceae cyanobacterium bins.59]|nr:GMC family oxidoreductase [Leptolyngbyaceae cyanobacterium bins.59]
MMIDARSLSPDEVFEAHVCIVGAGPAGITLAREFMNQNFQVCLLESGGLEYDPETQSLCEGTVVGDPYPEVQSTRRRQLGGTSHAWEGPSGYGQYGWRCLPLDEIDFEQRDWLPYSGWPFKKADLVPFYERAQQVCQIGPFAYNVEDWETGRAVRLPFKGDRVTTSMSQYGLRDPFTTEYREDLKQASNITTILYGNVVEIETDETAQTVTRLRVVCLQGRQFWVSAKLFVLATGGMENARLLLLSNQRQPAGLGNQQDVVGRYFMDRPILSLKLIPSSPQILQQTDLYDIYSVRGVPVMARVKLTEETMRREQLMNNGAQIFPRAWEHQRQAINSLKSLVTALRQGQVPAELAKALQVILQGSDYIAAAAFWAMVRKLPPLRRGDWSYLPFEKQRFSQFELFYQIEQAPDPNNRITLSRERDRLGLNKTEIHWQLNAIDVDHIVRIQEIWAEEFARSGLGELQFARRKEDFQYEKPAMHHHLGATRMHPDPKQGVVDANCQVHGIHNLFIAGCSVFPTSGYANPTLTMIALSLKLADHLKTRLS